MIKNVDHVVLVCDCGELLPSLFENISRFFDETLKCSKCGCFIHLWDKYLPEFEFRRENNVKLLINIWRTKVVIPEGKKETYVNFSEIVCNNGKILSLEIRNQIFPYLLSEVMKIGRSSLCTYSNYPYEVQILAAKSLDNSLEKLTSTLHVNWIHKSCQDEEVSYFLFNALTSGIQEKWRNMIFSACTGVEIAWSMMVRTLVSSGHLPPQKNDSIASIMNEQIPWLWKRGIIKCSSFNLI